MSNLCVLLVTSWGQPQCGIQAHSEMLMEAVKQADPAIEIVPSAEALNPGWVREQALYPYDIVHLNYHRALHSRWTPTELTGLRNSGGKKIVITFHDTFGSVEPDQLSRSLHDLADAFIVHEPCVGLPKALYWRQGVPDLPDHTAEWPAGYQQRPFLGSVGFDFGWKSYDLLCDLATEAGWGVLLYVPEMSAEREASLRARNPWLTVRRNRPTPEVLAGLHLCAATAFLYVNGNSGTSAAIRLGIGARKPVIAFAACRQFRDLLPDTQLSIWWADSVEDVRNSLRYGNEPMTGPWYFPTVALAERDSWRALGHRYATLYRSLVP